MKKLILSIVCLLLIFTMVGCGVEPDMSYDTHESDVNVTETDRWSGGYISYSRIYEYSSMEEYNTFVNNTELPTWFAEYDILSYIGDLSKLTLNYYGEPSDLGDKVTYDQLTEETEFYYSFAGIDDSVYIEFCAGDISYSVENDHYKTVTIQEDDLLLIDREKYGTDVIAYYDGIVPFRETKIAYVYGSLGNLRYIEFQGEGVLIKICFPTELIKEDGVCEEVLKYDRSNEEINKFLNKETAPYAADIMLNSIMGGKDNRFIGIPEEYR